MGAPAGKTKGLGPARTTRARTGCESLWRPRMPPKEASGWEEDRYTKYQGWPTRRDCLRSRARPARLSKLMSYRQTPVALTNNRMNQRAKILLWPGGGRRPKASFKATTKFNMGEIEKHTSLSPGNTLWNLIAYCAAMYIIRIGPRKHRRILSESGMGGPGSTQSPPAE